jgi:exodeoxyribonuclease VII small subunit
MPGPGDTKEDITFESGYEELKTIVARLGEDDVPVHEMIASFRRGRGLEEALRSYLTEREGELTEIEQGQNLPEFNITAPASAN